MMIGHHQNCHCRAKQRRLTPSRGSCSSPQRPSWKQAALGSRTSFALPSSSRYFSRAQSSLSGPPSQGRRGMALLGCCRQLLGALSTSMRQARSRLSTRRSLIWRLPVWRQLSPYTLTAISSPSGSSSSRIRSVCSLLRPENTTISNFFPIFFRKDMAWGRIDTQAVYHPRALGSLSSMSSSAWRQLAQWMSVPSSPNTRVLRWGWAGGVWALEFSGLGSNMLRQAFIIFHEWSRWSFALGCPLRNILASSLLQQDLTLVRSTSCTCLFCGFLGPIPLFSSVRREWSESLKLMRSRVRESSCSSSSMTLLPRMLLPLSSSLALSMRHCSWLSVSRMLCMAWIDRWLPSSRRGALPHEPMFTLCLFHPCEDSRGASRKSMATEFLYFWLLRERVNSILGVVLISETSLRWRGRPLLPFMLAVITINIMVSPDGLHLPLDLQPELVQLAAQPRRLHPLPALDHRTHIPPYPLGCLHWSPRALPRAHSAVLAGVAVVLRGGGGVGVFEGWLVEQVVPWRGFSAFLLCAPGVRGVVAPIGARGGTLEFILGYKLRLDALPVVCLPEGQGRNEDCVF